MALRRDPRPAVAFAVDDDPLAPARGALLGLGLSLPLWALILLALRSLAG